MAIHLKSQHVTNMYTPIELVTTGIPGAVHVGGGGGVTDHGQLHGLGDNDHPQYLLTANSSLLQKTANMTNYQPMSNSSLSLGIQASQSFFYTSNSSLLVAKSNSTLLQALSNSSLSLPVGYSTHTHTSQVQTNYTFNNYTDSKNGITFSTNGSNVEVTVTHGGIYGIMAGSVELAQGHLTMLNSNNVSFGIDLSGNLTASIPDIGGAQTGISGVGVSNTTYSSGSIYFRGNNNLTINTSVEGASQYLDFSVGNYLTTAANATHTHSQYVGQNTAMTGGSVTANTSGISINIPSVSLAFNDSNGISFGSSTSGANTTITASYNSTHTHGSLGTVSTSGTALVYSSSSNGLTLGVPTWITTYQGGGNNITLGGTNTLGTLTEISSGTATIAAGDNITLSQDGNAFTIIGAAAGTGGAGTGFTKTSVSGTEFKATLNAGGLNVEIPNYIITAAPVDHSHSDYQPAANNSLSLAVSESTRFIHTGNSSLLQAMSLTSLSLGTGATQSFLHTSASSLLQAVSNSNNSLGTGYTTNLMFVSASSLLQAVSNSSLSIGTQNSSNYFHTSASSLLQAISLTTLSLGTGYTTHTHAGYGAALKGSGTYTQQTGTVEFATGNGFTFGLSNNGVMTASGAFVNTSETGNMYFGGGSNITWGSSVSGASTSIMATAGGGTGGAAALSVSAGTLSATRDSIVFSNSNSVSFGMNGSTITASIPTIPSAGTVYFSDGNNITWSSSVSGVSTTILATAGGGTGGGVGTGTTVGQTSGTDLKLTLNATGINISVPAWLTTAASISHTHSDLYQSTGAYLTTAMPANNTSIFQYTSATSGITSNAMNTSERGNYFYSSNNTFANSTHTHTQFVGLGSTAITGGSATINSTGIELNIPQGSVYYSDGGGITFGASTNGLSTTITATVNAAGGAGTGFTSASTAGTALVGTLNSNGISLGIPAYLTAAGTGGGADWSVATQTGSAIVISTGAATNTLYHGNFLTAAGTGGGADWATATTSGSGIDVVTGAATNTIKYGNFLTTAAAAGHTHSDLYLPLGNSTQWATGTLSSALMPLSYSSGFQTATLAGTFMDKSYSSAFQTATLANTFMDKSYSSAFQTGTLANTFMDKSYSSAFQTATLANTFMDKSYSSGFQTGTLATALLPLGNSTQWATGTLSSALMPLSYSSGFQTATLATKFLTTQTVPTQFAGIGTTGVTGASATINSSQVQLNIPTGTVNFVDSNGVSWSSSVGTGASSLSTTIYVGNSIGAGGGAALKGSGTYSQNSGTVEFANSNGITFGLSNNGTFTASYNSTQFAGLNTGGTGCAITVNTSGVSVSVSAATGSIYFGDIAGYSWTSSTAASKTTFYLKTS